MLSHTAYESMDVMIAAGPFTSSADLAYAPLTDLIKAIDDKAPVSGERALSRFYLPL